MQTMVQEEIAAASAVSLYQSLASKSQVGHKRTCVDVSDASDEESVQTKRCRASNEHEPCDLKPAPFFHYSDYSGEVDEDPLAPLTPPCCPANFPAKMHAMLSRKDISDIVAWLPHGRAWRVLKPKAFASEVAPAYFGHSKYASFVRQANGWGFRRMTTGRDRGAYYHERFLRGLPHLCKKMRRQGVAEKKSIKPEHEPDLHRISEMHPLPEKASADDGLLLESTFQKVRPKRSYAAQSCSRSQESTPRSVTPPSESPCPQSPVKMTHNATQQGPAAQMSVPANLAVSTMCAPRAPLPVLASLQQQSLGSIQPLSFNTPFCQPNGLGASPQFAVGFVTAAAVMNSNRNVSATLLKQALLSASCGRPTFL